MAKKDKSAEDLPKTPEEAAQAALEEKVRLMMEPDSEETKPKKPTTEPKHEATSAPELEEINQTLKEALDTQTATDEVNEEIKEAVDNDFEPTEEPKEDEKTEEAVDEIVAKESDDVLEAEDEKIAEASKDDEKPKLLTRVKNLFKRWWSNPIARRGTLFAIGFLLLILFTVPNSRYFLLNTVGVRSSASLVILDDSTQKPLKNVKVSVLSRNPSLFRTFSRVETKTAYCPSG